MEEKIKGRIFIVGYPLTKYRDLTVTDFAQAPDVSVATKPPTDGEPSAWGSTQGALCHATLIANQVAILGLYPR